MNELNGVECSFTWLDLSLTQPVSIFTEIKCNELNVCKNFIHSTLEKILKLFTERPTSGTCLLSLFWSDANFRINGQSHVYVHRNDNLSLIALHLGGVKVFSTEISLSSILYQIDHKIEGLLWILLDSVLISTYNWLILIRNNLDFYFLLNNFWCINWEPTHQTIIIG